MAGPSSCRWVCDADPVTEHPHAALSTRGPVVAAIVPAAGSGTRLVADEGTPGLPKALRLLGSESLLRHAVRAVEHAVSQLIVPAAADQHEAVRSALDDVAVPVLVVEGGATRQESVRRALAVLDPAVQLVLVHDAARPLTPRDVTDRVLSALRHGAVAVTPVVEVADTLRGLTEDGSRPLDRARVRAVQTPQGFTVEILRRAHEGVDQDVATDDVGLAEALGVAVTLVEGDALAFKVTRAVDLMLAAAILQRQSAT